MAEKGVAYGVNGKGRRPMKKNKKTNGVILVVICGLTSLVLAAALAALIAYGITTEFITQDLAEILTPVIIAVAVFAAALFAVNSMNQNQKLAGALSVACIYFLSCVIIKLSLFPGSTNHMLRNLIICILAALGAWMLCGRRGKRKTAYAAKRHR